MAVPWLRLIDAGIGWMIARGRRRRRSIRLPENTGSSRGRGCSAASKPVSPVSSSPRCEKRSIANARRLELEREQLEAERQRAERALKLELLRQAADREIGRLRLLAGVAAASFLGTLFLAPRVIGGAMTGRLLIGLGWALLLGALGFVFTAHRRSRMRCGVNGRRRRMRARLHHG